MAGQTVAERLGLEKGHHELKIGKSFASKDLFHTIRYDFKPASVDINQESKVLVGSDNAVEVNVPHVQGSGTTHTVYKGNKRALQKECVLIINHDTGEIALEKLNYAIQLKKTRSEPSARMTINPRPLTPIEKTKASPVRKAPVKPHPSAASQSTHIAHKPAPTHLTSPADIFAAELGTADMDMSSSSSSGSSSGNASSDSDSDVETNKNTKSTNKAGNSQQENRRVETLSASTAPHTQFLHTLSQDLRLSESSDDDSD